MHCRRDGIRSSFYARARNFNFGYDNESMTMKRPNSVTNIGNKASTPMSSNNKTPATVATSGSGLFNSYQKQTTSSNYEPPVYYAANQTSVLQDTTKVYYQTEDNANNVLTTMTQQRQQVVNANESVWNMRSSTEQVKRELNELHMKYIMKKRRLYIYIIVLSVIDLLLFIRILQCHGNFYCF